MQRPRLRPPRSRLEIGLEVAAALGLLVTIWVIGRDFSAIEGPAPIHFGLSGEPDAYGGKGWLLVTPAISLSL